MIRTEHHPQFFTATILEWKKLLQPDKYKTIVTDSLSFLVKENRAVVNAFVVMDNHLHIIWQAINGCRPEQIQHNFLKYTAQKIKFDLVKHHPNVLKHFKVDATDREYQFWERNPLSIGLYTEVVFSPLLVFRTIHVFCTCWCRPKKHAIVVCFHQRHKTQDSYNDKYIKGK